MSPANQISSIGFLTNMCCVLHHSRKRPAASVDELAPFNYNLHKSGWTRVVPTNARPLLAHARTRFADMLQVNSHEHTHPEKNSTGRTHEHTHTHLAAGCEAPKILHTVKHKTHASALYTMQLSMYIHKQARSHTHTHAHTYAHTCKHTHPLHLITLARALVAKRQVHTPEQERTHASTCARTRT